jgi:hypothetical protein
MTDSSAAAGTAGGAAVAGLALAAGGRWLTAAVASAVARPSVRWGGLAAAGAALTAGAVVWYDRAEHAALERSERDLAAVTERPPTRPAGAAPTTDRGHPVPVHEPTDPRARAELAALETRMLDGNGAGTHVIRRQPADDRSNCHGWVFTGGRYWVNGADVESILADNGYRVVAEPRPGDLIVYRQNGAVAHSAVVRYVTPGLPVLVEGKWGVTGVYLHAAGESIYGPDFAYYRADRPTHVLAGLDVPPANAGGQ